MALEPVQNLFGEARISSHAPTVSAHERAIYAPFSKDVFFDRYPGWGLYDADGFLIESAAYRRGPSMVLIGQSERYQGEAATIDSSNEEVVYFGPLIPHYGHFVVSSLARAWFVGNSDLRRGRRILCHSDHPPDRHFAMSFMGDLVRGMGLDDADFISPERPLRFADVVVPTPAFIEQNEASEAFIAPLHRIGDRVLGRHPVQPTAKIAYLSKSRVSHGAVTHITNEIELEDILRDRGMDIFHPEQMNFAEQVRLFAAYRVVVAFVGSGLHTHAFVRRPPEIIGISMDPFVNSNVVLVDRLNKANARYYYPRGNIQNTSTPGYGSSRTIRNCLLLAQDLIDAAGG